MTNRTLPTEPRTLRAEYNREQRMQMLADDHIKPLIEYVLRLRDDGFGEVPYFDPLDGGTNASILFLLEKPGPMTSTEGNRTGSGFISRDNDDPTAEATFKFMQQATVPRQEAVLWNTVPGWNGTRKITADELKMGITALSELFPMLPRLQTIVLVGGKAQRAEKLLSDYGLNIAKSDHPSPIVRASRPERWARIPHDWQNAYSINRTPTAK